jgi:hypothetical protein
MKGGTMKSEFKFWKHEISDMTAMAAFVAELIRQQIDFVAENVPTSEMIIIIIYRA